MKTRKRFAIALGLLFLLAARSSADVIVLPLPVNIRIHSNSTLITDTNPGVDLRLPPGYFMDEPTRDKLDGEVKRLQDAETRLKAENESLRDSSRHYFPGWTVFGAAFAAGLAGGIWIGLKLQ